MALSWGRSIALLAYRSWKDWPPSTMVPTLAVEHLLPARFDLWKMGGSHAQRDVIDWTLAEAAVRAGQRDIALSLAHERLATRPESVPNRRFLHQAEAIAA